MRCPKCQYISFDSGERCRNCGYEFVLAVDEPPIDVTIGRDEPAPGRVRDVSLSALDADISPGRRPVDSSREAGTIGQVRRPLTMSDLPLFTDRVADDQAPLINPPAVPRPPLSVRRTSPTERHRSSVPEELSFDLNEAGELEAEDEHASHVDAEETAVPDDTAGIFRRFGAGLIDLMVMGAIEFAVIYLTLRLCELTLDQWRLLPVLPLAAFLLLLVGGYFVLFTAAGGQTIGKMATGIRVVASPEAADSGPRVSFGAAVVRAVACFGSVLALGAGFLPVLFRADRRAFHDRVAETRVIIA